MNESLIKDLIASPGDRTTQSRLFDDESGTFFWVDHGECDEEIIGYCEKCLKTGKLSAKFDEHSVVLEVVFDGKKTRVPLKQSPDDRHITLWTLSQALAPYYEIRLIRASIGGDTLAFLPLASTVWERLEEEFGAKRVANAFMRLSETPNVFTDPLPVHQARPWWKFW